MFIGFMKMIYLIYTKTWFIWPFLFVFSFSYGIAGIIKNKDDSGKGLLVVASISLFIIIAGIITPNFY